MAEVGHTPLSRPFRNSIAARRASASASQNVLLVFMKWWTQNKNLLPFLLLVPGNLPSTKFACNLGCNLRCNLRYNLRCTLRCNLRGKLRGNLRGNLLGNLRGKLRGKLRGNLRKGTLRVVSLAGPTPA